MANGPLPIAIDFGAASLKLLQLQQGDGDHLVAAACMDTPEELRTKPVERLTHQAQALLKLMKNVGFRGKRAMCTLPAPRTFAQVIQTPRFDGGSLLDAVKLQLQRQTNCDPSRVVIRPIPVAQSSDEDGQKHDEVICFAAAREMVMELVAALRACKIECVGVHSEHMALARAFDHITRRDADSELTSLYIDIGAGTTKLVINHGRTPAFVRTAPFGGATLDAAAARATGCSLEEARAKRFTLASYATPARAATPQPSASTAGAEGAGAPLDHCDGAGDAVAALAAPAAVAEATERREGAPLPGSASVEHGDADSAGSNPINLHATIEPLIDELSMSLRHHARLFPARSIDRAIFVGGEARNTELCASVARALRLPAQIADPLAPVTRTGRETTRGIDMNTPQPGWAVAFGLSHCPPDS